MQALAMLALKEMGSSPTGPTVLFGYVGKRSCDGRQFLELQGQVIISNSLVDLRLGVAGTHRFLPKALH